MDFNKNVILSILTDLQGADGAAESMRAIEDATNSATQSTNQLGTARSTVERTFIRGNQNIVRSQERVNRATRDQQQNLARLRQVTSELMQLREQGARTERGSFQATEQALRSCLLYTSPSPRDRG